MVAKLSTKTVDKAVNFKKKLIIAVGDSFVKHVCSKIEQLNFKGAIL